MAYSAENVAADYNALFNSEQAPKLVYNKAEKTAMVQDNPSVIISPRHGQMIKISVRIFVFVSTIRDVARTTRRVLECSPDLSYRTAG